MKSIHKIIAKTFLIVCVGLFYGNTVLAQTIVSGTVIDANDKNPVPSVVLSYTGSKGYIVSDIDGNYKITIDDKNVTHLKFNFMGYKTYTAVITPGKTQVINIKLQPNVQALNEVIVKAGKRSKYSNKNNPAVELIEKVIANKEKNRLQSYPFVEYKQYEQMVFSMSNLSDKFKNRKIFKNYQFLFKEQDSTKIGGKNVLPIYLEERLTENFYKKSPEKKKTVVLANKQVNFDSKFVDNEGMKKYFDKMYQDINIYDNNISLVSNQLLSPIANSAPTFYRFYITDTLKNHEPQLIELSYTPKSKTDLLFQGKLYITLDGKYAVQKAHLSVNSNINLNFVRALEADLDFIKNDDGKYLLNKSNLLIDFGLSKNKGGGFTGERTVTLDSYITNREKENSFYDGESLVIAADAGEKSDLFWSENRLDSISTEKLQIYKNIDTLQTIPSFKRAMDIATLLFVGYKDFGKFEVGPVNTFYSFNDIEGFRLRVGGRTTTDLSKRYYFETYAAYGFKDEKWKYFLSGTYSLNNKSIYKFPQHYLRASFQRDTKIPGQELQFVQEDNFLLSFKRGENTTLLYNDYYKIDYIKEYENHFSYGLGFKKWTQRPGGTLAYLINDGNGIKSINNITTSEFGLNLRYAPNEKFYQGKLYRTPLYDKYPIFSLRYNLGVKGLLGGEYNYHNFVGNIEKRFYLSQLGYADVSVEGGYILGKVPYPLLTIHRANQTYAYQLKSYNLMNFMEFVSDHYASLNVDYYLNGFVFNKIPLIRRLKLREVVSFKGLYGGLRDENNPNKDASLMQFSKNDLNQPISYSLNRDPYMEGSVGVTNIFKVLRVDLVKRFNYLDNPSVTEWGIRARVKFDF